MVERPRILAIDVPLDESLDAFLSRIGDLIAATRAEAAELLDRLEPDLVLFGARPGHLEALRLLEDLVRRVPPDEYLPILVLLYRQDDTAARTALALGAKDVVARPFDAEELALRVSGLLRTRAQHRALAEATRALREHARRSAGAMLDMVRRLEESQIELHVAEEATIERFAVVAELRDDPTRTHVQRVGRYSELIASRLGLDGERCRRIRLAARLHDVGLVAVPERILRKRAPLTEDDRRAIRGHAEAGSAILGGTSVPVLELAATIAATHHERVDGSGYPLGLHRDEIPLEGRIVAAADTFDALTTPRPYRDPLDVPVAVEEMRGARGSQLDPEATDALLGSLDEALEIRSAHPPGLPVTSGGGGAML